MSTNSHDRDDFGRKARNGHRARMAQDRRAAIAESIELDEDNR